MGGKGGGGEGRGGGRWGKGGWWQSLLVVVVFGLVIFVVTPTSDGRVRYVGQVGRYGTDVGVCMYVCMLRMLRMLSMYVGR